MSETDRFGAGGRLPVAARDDVNLAGLSDLFQAQRLDAIVCRGGLNVTYLSGMAMPGTLGRHLDLAETERPVFLVWQADRPAVLVVSEIASQVARSKARVDKIETYVDYLDDPEQKLVEVLHAMGLSASRIGFDSAWFGAARWSEIQRSLPDVTVVDCTRGLDLVRAVKTPAEVESLRAAADLLDSALVDVFRSISAGDTERQVHAHIVARAIELGADSAHGILQSSSNNVLYGGESSQQLQDGDLVRTDYVLYLNGYAANLSRPLHIGKPSPATRTRHEQYVQVCRRAVALLRSGAVGGEVHRSIQGLFVSAGWQPGPPISGHGIGRWFHQQRPLLVNGSTDRLATGMVVALEPISGYWHLQDEFLITDGDPVRISIGFDWETLPWTA